MPPALTSAKPIGKRRPLRSERFLGGLLVTYADFVRGLGLARPDFSLDAHKNGWP